MEIEQPEIVKYVLKAFLVSEYDIVPQEDAELFAGAIGGKKWDQFDTDMVLLSWLTDDELYREASICHEYHVSHNARCHEDHTGSECPIVSILKVIEILLERYETYGKIAPVDRYLFEYYLCLEQGEMILVD